MKTFIKKYMSAWFFVVMMLGFFSINPLQAQSDKEKVNAVKVGFFTQEMGLSSSEAEKFWPLYFEYQDKKEVIRRNPSQNPIQMQESELELSKEYDKKFRTVLPANKIDLMYQAEKKFRDKLIETATQRKGGN